MMPDPAEIENRLAAIHRQERQIRRRAILWSIALLAMVWIGIHVLWGMR